MTVIARRPITDTLADWVEAFVGRPVGRMQPPKSLDDTTRPFPYVTLYVVPGGGFSGAPLAAPDADASLVYQANCVALRAGEADDLLDAVRHLWLARNPATGRFIHAAPDLGQWTVMDRRPDGTPGGIDFNGAPPRRVFTGTERFVLDLTLG